KAAMSALWLFSLVTLAAQGGEVDTEIVASVSEELDRIRLRVRSDYKTDQDADSITVVLAAARYADVPKGMRPSEEREVFRAGFDFGGFESVVVSIEGRACTPTAKVLPDGAVAISCPFTVQKKQ